jgi:hypothetical protein
VFAVNWRDLECHFVSRGFSRLQWVCVLLGRSFLTKCLVGVATACSAVPSRVSDTSRLAVATDGLAVAVRVCTVVVLYYKRGQNSDRTLIRVNLILLFLRILCINCAAIWSQQNHCATHLLPDLRVAVGRVFVPQILVTPPSQFH